MDKAGKGKTVCNRLLAGLLRVLSFSALVFSVCALRPIAISAEVPLKLTYQGNLRQVGFLVTGQRSMMFRIYASSFSTTELWASPAYDIRVSTGVFRVVLEPVLPDWQTGSLWLELDVEGNRMSPREELTSVPYSINSLMLSGKRYTTAASAPAAPVAGELWYDSAVNAVKFWNGGMWVDTSGGGIPGVHAASHAGTGSDPVVSLGTHTVTGYITVSSSVSAGWFYGSGSGLYNLDASKISTGELGGDRIGNVIVSTHIVDGSILGQDLADGSVSRAKLNRSGCSNGDTLQLSGAQWVCGSGASAGLEVDPVSIHNQDVLQAGSTFYVSSGTANDLSANNSLKVMGAALLRGAPGQQGLSVEATGNVGIGLTEAATARLEVKGVDTQAYSLAVGTGAAHQVIVSTAGAVGIGTETPRAKMEVSGGAGLGEYIIIFNSGFKLAAWLRNK